MNRFFGCLGDRGYDVVPDRQTNGLLTYSIAGAGQESAMDACADGTTAQVEPLYSAMVENPGNTPTDADVAQRRRRR